MTATDGTTEPAASAEARPGAAKNEATTGRPGGEMMMMMRVGQAATWLTKESRNICDGFFSPA